MDMPSLSRSLLPALLAALVAGPVAAQAPLTVRDALQRADAHGFGNRIAAASAQAADARAAGALRGVLPTFRVEAGWVRSDDPLATFGFLLRQRDVTAAAFDPAGLNDPPARSDISTGLVLEAPLLNADAWAARRGAALASDATRESADWTRSGTALDVVRAYYAAILARQQVATLEQAAVAVAAHVHEAEAAAANGLVTRSDALLAGVRQGDIETQLDAARSAAMIARLRLALATGTPGDTLWTLPGAVPILAPLPADSGTRGPRADVRAALAGRDAAEADRTRANLAMLPRVNGFGRYDWHDAGSLAAGKTMWTVGVMATWSPFTGGAELADRRRAAADAAGATAGAEAAQAAATLEQQAASAAASVAARALVTAGRSVQQATEAHRIITRKYAGGLAAVSELLDAQSAELATRLAEARARYDVVVARAQLARADGTDLTQLAAVLDAATAHPEP
jgi:outer membrane protein TolC